MKTLTKIEAEKVLVANNRFWHSCIREFYKRLETHDQLHLTGRSEKGIALPIGDAEHRAMVRGYRRIADEFAAAYGFRPSEHRREMYDYLMSRQCDEDMAEVIAKYKNAKQLEYKP